MKKVKLKVLKEMCGTCPFKPGSKYEFLRDQLKESALSAGRICHSTGSGNGINHRTGKPAAICRGARDFQLQYMHALGVIKDTTDKAWNDACKDMGISPDTHTKRKGKSHEATKRPKQR